MTANADTLNTHCAALVALLETDQFDAYCVLDLLETRVVVCRAERGIARRKNRDFQTSVTCVTCKWHKALSHKNKMASINHGIFVIARTKIGSDFCIL